MVVTIFTVSYMNDNDSHSEWLHLYYSSLFQELRNKDVEVNHFILLNDGHKIKAKKNIEDVISDYEFDFYNPFFIKIDSEREWNELFHHAFALDNGIKRVYNNSTNLVKSTDLFLIEEFDIIHRKGYLKKLEEFRNFSEKMKTFIGRIDPGVLLLSDNDVDGFDLNEYNPPGKLEGDQKLNIRFPRIMPHFLVFSSNLFTDFLGFEKRFKDEISFNCKEFLESKDCCSIHYDTGSDFLNELVSDKNFFHLGEIEFIEHLKGISWVYRRLLHGEEWYERSPSSYKSELKEKVERVVEDYDYLLVSEKCSLFNDKLSFDFLE